MILASGSVIGFRPQVSGVAVSNMLSATTEPVGALGSPVARKDMLPLMIDVDGDVHVEVIPPIDPKDDHALLVDRKQALPSGRYQAWGIARRLALPHSKSVGRNRRR